MDWIYNVMDHLVQQQLLPPAFEHPFMVRALLGALLTGPMLGALGTLVVRKRLVFFSQTLCHASLTGVAIGLFFGEPPGETYGGLYGFTLLVAVIMLYVRHRTQISSDTVSGLILAQVMGLGVVALVVVTKQFNIHQVEAILFGSLITLSDQDIVLMLVICTTVAALVLLIYNRSVLIGFNPVMAKVHGVPVVAYEYMLIILITAVIVASLKIIGALLVLALLVIPSAAAQNFFSTLSGHFWLSVTFAAISAVGGLVLSALWSIPTGGAIVLLASIIFYVSLVLRPIFGRTTLVQGR